MKVSIPFMKGVQTKVEHQILPSGDLTLLENGEFNKIGSIEKRKGYSALAVEDGNLKRTDLISHGKDLIARNVSSDPNNTPLSAEAYSLANGRFIGKKGISQGIGYTSMPVSAGSSYRQENPQVAFSDDGKYALVTFVALESEHESTRVNPDPENFYNNEIAPTGIVVKKCSLIDRETNTIIASDIPVGRYYGQSDTAASVALTSAVYKYQGSRMKPIWRNGKFYIFGIDAKTTGVTATPYEPTLNVYSLDPTREPVQISNMAGEYSLTATYGTEASLPSGYSIPNYISASFPYGPHEKKNYGFSFDICNHDDDDKAYIILTVLDGTTSSGNENARVELHVVDFSSSSISLTSPVDGLSHQISTCIARSNRYGYVENTIFRASNGYIYYAFLGPSGDPSTGDSGFCVEVHLYYPNFVSIPGYVSNDVIIDMDPLGGILQNVQRRKGRA